MKCSSVKNASRVQIRYVPTYLERRKKRMQRTEQREDEGWAIEGKAQAAKGSGGCAAVCGCVREVSPMHESALGIHLGRGRKKEKKKGKKVS